MVVPTKQSKRKNIKVDPVFGAIKLMKTIAENDPAKDAINFMKDDIEKARQHEVITANDAVIWKSTTILGSFLCLRR